LFFIVNKDTFNESRRDSFFEAFLFRPLNHTGWRVTFSMRKISFLFMLIAVSLILISCGKDDQELATINPGLYEISHEVKYKGQLLVLKQRVRYNADGTYEATNFQNNAAVEELRGKYRVENKKLVSFDSQRRIIAQEGAWEPKADVSKVDIRKMKKGSYQYYFTFPDEQTHERYKGLGLSEGWKTYRRISD
jgi:hypothetical protein